MIPPEGNASRSKVDVATRAAANLPESPANLADPTSMLADAAARHRIVTDLDRTYFVEAGAGTGKTTALVARVVNLVAAGRVTMDRLAAITFTDAAAAELRDRIREGLERAATSPRPAVETSPVASHAPAEPSAAAELRQGLQRAATSPRPAVEPTAVASRAPTEEPTAAAELRVSEGLERAAVSSHPPAGPSAVASPDPDIAEPLAAAASPDPDTAEDPLRSPAARERCRIAAIEIDRASISTIHAFAGQLLRTFPIEAGLPPGFATLDEIEQAMHFEERFDRWFWRDALEEPLRSVVKRGLLLGLSRDTFRRLAYALEDRHHLLSADQRWPAVDLQPALPVARIVGTRFTQLQRAIPYALDGEADPLVQLVSSLRSSARQLLAAQSEDDALSALLGVPKLRAAVEHPERWNDATNGRNAAQVVLEVLEDMDEHVRTTLGAHRAWVLANLLTHLRDFVLEGVAARRAEGQATFHDLLAWTRDLLRDNPSVRHAAQQRFERICIDEFQDTDPLQAEIAFCLAADERASQSDERESAATEACALPADWRDIRLVPGKLFVVGDPKQSIYRFRGADIGIYDDLLGRFADCRERLTHNFRSVQPVLAWVNHHFDRHMRARTGVQPEYAPLAVQWPAYSDGAACGVRRVGTLVDGSSGEAADAEARALASLALDAVQAGWQVSDTDLATGNRLLRPATFRDICILLPTRTHLHRLERALEEWGVPYRLEAGKLVLATQEVRDLLACLRAIEDPSDQIALVAALRSPAYACSDVDLLRWVESGGRLDHERPRHDASNGPSTADSGPPAGGTTASAPPPLVIESGSATAAALLESKPVATESDDAVADNPAPMTSLRDGASAAASGYPGAMTPLSGDAGPGASENPVAAALENLADFHRRRLSLSPAALIEAFIEERLLVAAAFGEPRPRETWRRLRYVVSRARAFTGTGRHSLRAFLDWIEGLQRAEVRDPEAGSIESDEDAIHIQTIHGAKGLEYPIVFLAGLGAPARWRSAGVEVLLNRDTGTLACRLGQGWETPDYAVVQSRERQLAQAEAVRLLYVAATRAREHLILSLHRGVRAEDSAAAVIERYMEDSPAELCPLITSLPPTPPTSSEAPFRPGIPPVPIEARAISTDEAEAAWLAARTRRIAAAAIAEDDPGVVTLKLEQATGPL